MIDELLKFNREFVKSKGYERFITNKYPDKKIAIVSCMDTRQECWGDYFPSFRKCDPESVGCHL